jgi:hypothetical protein
MKSLLTLICLSPFDRRLPSLSIDPEITRRQALVPITSELPVKKAPVAPNEPKIEFQPVQEMVVNTCFRER